ncbi:hypothetical protein PsYK624_008340 [Phanerochaete sordida]|uniref:Uncharacterized protein n=1 Tax=Phanerochaete sordida TaxID=48140 RepID=A0A9P3FY77_9APHY|nr:hypothetical protein PsYK624_008340 [Phanerochaete sordida]
MADSNDASSVQALLARLRASQAWHEATQVRTPAAAGAASDPGPPQGMHDTPPPAIAPAAVDVHEEGGPAAPSHASVASLLAQLQSAGAADPTRVVEPQVPENPAGHESPRMPQPSVRSTDPRLRERSQPASAARKHDLRNVSFQQALPAIAQLSEDQAFVDAIRKVKNDQAMLEKRLWEERQAIQKRHEEKVKLARTKASVIGASLSKFEADNMTDAFRRELQRFDRERVLPAWDGLITKQQATLESLGVPTMFPTVVSTERQKQQRVVQVVSGVIE